MCIGISEFYIKINYIFASIFTTLKPIALLNISNTAANINDSNNTNNTQNEQLQEIDTPMSDPQTSLFKETSSISEEPKQPSLFEEPKESSSISEEPKQPSLSEEPKQPSLFEEPKESSSISEEPKQPSLSEEPKQPSLFEVPSSISNQPKEEQKLIQGGGITSTNLFSNITSQIDEPNKNESYYDIQSAKIYQIKILIKLF